MANYVQLCSTRGECGNNPGLLMMIASSVNLMPNSSETWIPFNVA
jgi:hypothetical protein